MVKIKQTHKAVKWPKLKEGDLVNVNGVELVVLKINLSYKKRGVTFKKSPTGALFTFLPPSQTMGHWEVFD